MVNTDRFYTDSLTDITDWIAEGRTNYFSGTSRETELEAEELARKKKTYVYNVHGWDRQGDFVHKGYAVPN